MRKIWNWVRNNPNRTMFLIPILLVAGISISHVVAWYDIANPFNWAVYLSIAIEVGAMTALVAATNKIKGGVWFMFGLVTLIQFIGNIFYSYKEIDPNSESFKMWVELTGPIWDMFSDSSDILSMKRWLAILEGGLLPIISLTSLHFFVKYEKKEDDSPKMETEGEPEKRIFNIEVEDIPDEDVESYVKETMEKLKKEPEFESDSDFNPMDITEDHSLIEEENPEDEIIVKPEKVIKTEPRMVREDFPKPTPPPTKIIKEGEKPPHEEKETPGEKLNQTWRNIIKRRRGGNNGVSRI
jgi:hypothetical protein